MHIRMRLCNLIHDSSHMHTTKASTGRTCTPRRHPHPHYNTSIMNCPLVPEMLKVSPVSPAIRVPPHGITWPVYKRCHWQRQSTLSCNVYKWLQEFTWLTACAWILKSWLFSGCCLLDDKLTILHKPYFGAGGSGNRVSHHASRR